VIVAIEAFASTFGASGVGAGVETVATEAEAAGLALVVPLVVGVLSQAPTNKAAAKTPADKETFTRFFFITIDFSLFVFRSTQPAEKTYFRVS